MVAFEVSAFDRSSPFELSARGSGSRGMSVVKRSALFFDRGTFRCDLLVVLRLPTCSNTSFLFVSFFVDPKKFVHLYLEIECLQGLMVLRDDESPAKEKYRIHKCFFREE